MKLEMTGQMRLEQRMKLAPRMIQSMEILQLPIMALQERIEQELNSNPVLEVDETHPTETDSAQQLEERPARSEEENFDRFESLNDEYSDWLDQSAPRRKASADTPDPKFEALKNTEAPAASLHDHLMDQWRLVEADPPVLSAGEKIIDYIDDRGYLSVRLEQLYNKDRCDFSIKDLNTALALVQQLEPTGIGARSLKECLLIQMAQSPENMEFERRLVSEHMGELLDNKLPIIAQKMGTTLEHVTGAIERMSRFDTSPGLQVSSDRNHAISVDVIVEPTDDGDFTVSLADSNLPPLRISDYYVDLAKNKSTNGKTKKFLQTNIRSAQWIMDAIEQRRNTLLKVSRSIVNYQKEFFQKGQLHLKPLPMQKVADDVGVHIATVSRAVNGKHLQCHLGIIPLRNFFSGGTEDANGQAKSWQAVRAKLQQIIDNEDKLNPLNDDTIKQKLAEAGINNIARRTVAKYRKLMNIPAAKYRKKY